VVKWKTASQLNGRNVTANDEEFIMSKKPLSLKQLHKSGSVSVETDRMPNYITKPPKFSCPLSSYIMWHHNLEYTECPLSSDQRDMGTCAKCKLRGDSKAKIKGKKDKPLKKNFPKVEKRHKEPIPKIGKTYTSK
jgi:hypothetical protein